MSRFLIALAGLALSLVVVLLALKMPIGGSLTLLSEGSFSNWYGLSATLVKSIPLVLVALGVAVAWRAGMFSIGGEGQFIFGGVFGATLFHVTPNAPGPVLTVGVIVMGAIGGALLASLAAWLFIARGIQVVISTILLNFIAIQVLSWVVTGPLNGGSGVPMSKALPTTAMLTKFDRQADLHVGVFVAILAAVALAIYLWWTVGGFRLRLVGHAPSVARANRVPVARTQFQAMALSGALCGLAGAVEYVGLAGQLSTGFSQNWGFLAIPVALLGGLNPLGILVSGVFFAALLAGSENLGRYTQAGSAIVFVVQAVAVLGYIAVDARRVRKSGSRGVGESG